jgi:alpha-tubulin suppressor-like RCC1 family protein
MRALLRLTLAGVFAASLVACRDDLLPTDVKPARPNANILAGGGGGIGIVIDPNQYISITAGDNFTCVTRANNKVYCWGQNNFGQTGVGPVRGDCYGLRNVNCTPVPTMLLDPNTGGPLLALRVDAGATHACLVDLNRTAWCWGSGGVGELGVAPVWTTAMPPTPVAGPITVNTISAGTNSTCAQLTNGDISCWGNINSGTTPVKFTTSAGALVSLAVGNQHACFIPSRSGTVLCFGKDSEGQGGHVPSPFTFIVPISTLFGFSTGVVSQEQTTCSNTFVGTVECSGWNTEGMLGNGNPMLANTTTPVSVGAGGVAQTLSSVTVGKEHACALDPNGAAFCWGGGKKGELGDGRNVSSSVPVAVAGGRQFRGIAAGLHHTCAISSYEIWCWGDNFSSQLGVFSATPGEPVQAPSPPIEGNFPIIRR